MPSTLRPEEEWARRSVQSALGLLVCQHDDGSSPGMHDLDIRYADGTRGAVEVTAAADGDSIALWNLMNGGGGRWIAPELAGGWMVALLPTARAKRLRDELPALLSTLERQGVSELRTVSWRRPHPLEGRALDLGVAHAHQSGTDFPASIYITLELPDERTGGMVAATADAVPMWLEEFLRHAHQADVLAKLGRSGTVERHAFVIVPGLTTAPFAVTDPLTRDDVGVPTSDPDLPTEVTHVWVAGTWVGGRGIRWAPASGWTFFDTNIEAG